MMFKNLILYRAQDWLITPHDLSEALQKEAFQPCLPSQQKSIGWIAPNGGPMVEVVNGHWIAQCAIQTKTVPAEAIDQLVQADIQLIEQDGRQPGSKEIAALKYDAMIALLPQAFPKTVVVTVWYLPNGLLAIDSSTLSRADEVVSAFVSATELPVHPIVTSTAPRAAMREWLTGHADPDDFRLGQSCELRSLYDDSSSRIRYSNYHLDAQEIQTQIEQGCEPVSLELEATDVTFNLTDTMHLKKIRFEPGIFGGDEEDQFSADVTLKTILLASAINAVIESLGGETN